MAVAQATKSGKKTTTTTASKKSSKAAPSHPPYIDMITEALVSLKERTGSSHYAIAKHIEEQQKVKDLPSNFKKLLFNQLKKFVASGKLVKVKNSFKLPPSSAAVPSKVKSADKSKPKAKETKKPAKKETVVKAKAVKKAKASVTVTKKVTKSPAKKVAPPKAKKPKSIKSPAKKTSAKKTTKK